ncbi:MAG: S-layer homology domain-containing protein [Candidatus Gracilibacteria bacterium]
MKTKEIVSGYEDGTFKPDNPINRAEAAKIIDKAFNIDTTKEYHEVFSDVKKDNWFFPFVMAGKEAGFINGYNDGTFQPTKQVKMSETLKMVLNASKAELPLRVTSTVFIDVQKDAWVAVYALYAREHNIVLADKEGKIYPDKEMTRGTFAEIVYRMMIVLGNNGKEFPIDGKWAAYDSPDSPFKMKFNAESWQIIQGKHDVVFFNPDEDRHQFSATRVYPNSAKIEVLVDKNSENLSDILYFENIKSSFPDANYQEFMWNNFKALEVLYPEKKIVDWYIYLNDGFVMVVYTQYGDGPESFRFPRIIKAMLGTLEYKDMEISFVEDYTETLATIFKNILVENKGIEMLSLLPDKTIIETDAIGVGTGPVDYYYSEGVNYTFKYERTSDVILDKRQGRTSAF